MTLRSAPKHNYAQERSTVIINLEGIESNEKKETTIHFRPFTKLPLHLGKVLRSR